jgi:hypothetical protein
MDTKHTTDEQITEIDFWRRSARKSRKEKVRNVAIREIMEVRKNILEVTEEKRLRWFGHVKRMPGNTATENFRMGTRGKTQRKMDRWSKTEHDKPWTDRREY